MNNYLSIDFESWAYPRIPSFLNLNSSQRKTLDNGYVVKSAELILKILAKHKTKITFFVIAELYYWYPEVINMIQKEGHEVAYHTYRHEYLENKEVLIKTLNNSSKFIKNFKPKGFRAPEIYMKKEFLSILNKYGFTYDSSIYGPYSLKRKEEQILEIPISTYPLITKPQIDFPRGLRAKMLLTEPPVGSGYLIAVFGKAIGKIFSLINKKGYPFVAFIHNWQIVPPKDAIFPDKKYILRHPAYLPYTRNCYRVFEYLVANFKLSKMQEIQQN